MYDRFRWTNTSVRRNGLTMEYEPLQPYFFLALAKMADCGTFIDVGANVGIYSLFTTLLPNLTRVVAFEANPETVRELRSNIALNRLDQIIVVREKAVSSQAGELTFGVVSRFSGANSVVETSIHNRAAFHKQIIVEAVTLDQEFPTPIDHPFAIKIDVEGHESKVIDGGRSLLANNSGLVQLERYGPAGGAITETLNRLGYAHLTSIGPDSFYSNLPSLQKPEALIEAYELASRELIEANHRNKAIVIKRGNYALHLTGKSADLVRRVAKRLVGRHL